MGVGGCVCEAEEGCIVSGRRIGRERHWRVVFVVRTTTCEAAFSSGRTMHVAVSTQASIKRVLVLDCAPGARVVRSSRPSHGGSLRSAR